MRPRPPLRPYRFLALVLGLLGPLLAAVPAGAGTATIELTASASLVGFGDGVTLTATLGGDAGCLEGREVTLQWRPADSAGSATVGSATTHADGAASFQQSQPHTGRYRVSVAATDTCPSVVSAETLVRVRAYVEVSIVSGSGEAGSCVGVFASVQPSRPGQVVDLQQRRGGGWTTLEQLMLDADSQASTSPCFGFDDIGVVRLRARWVAQDPLNETASSTTFAFQITGAPWMQAIDDAIGGRSVSVAVGEEDVYLYRQDDDTPRAPASNEKLLLSMALLDAFPPDLRLRTSAAVTGIDEDGVVEDLWVLGHGDPRVSKATIRGLAAEIADAGVTRVRGRVMGSTGFFRRDWDATGWNDAARTYVNRPTALTFEGNDVAHAERRAAQELAERLEALGIRVAGKAGSGSPPDTLVTVAFVRSRPLMSLLTKMLRPSDNFVAEVLGKRLGVESGGTPGTIAKGAAAIEDYVDGHGADFTLYDNSGLSYANRISAEGMVRLLWVAEDTPWYTELRAALPTGGQGTLRDRLHGVPVRAKTGTLTAVSALSGWVYSAGSEAWVEFSILSSGMAKDTASAIEDRIVRILARRLP